MDKSLLTQHRQEYIRETQTDIQIEGETVQIDKTMVINAQNY